MATTLTVEAAGFGICQDVNPYSILVICVQQESFQAWTVYRRFNSFEQLALQLKSVYKNLPELPNCDPGMLHIKIIILYLFFSLLYNVIVIIILGNLALQNLELCRQSMDSWLKNVTSNPRILCTQSMYQFLCVDANMQPPYLEVHWRNSQNGSFDEMDMDDMFEVYLYYLYLYLHFIIKYYLTK